MAEGKFTGPAHQLRQGRSVGSAQFQDVVEWVTPAPRRGRVIVIAPQGLGGASTADTAWVDCDGCGRHSGEQPSSLSSAGASVRAEGFQSESP